MNLLNHIDLITFLGSDIKRTNVGYKLLKNVKIDNDVCYYSTLNSGEEFDGNNKSITISNNNTEGLFSIDVDINNPAIIKNLKVNAISTGGGGIIRPNSKGFYCIKCSWKGSILGIYDNNDNNNILGSGGICGYNCTDFIIEDCKNKGKIGPSGGGICGSGCYNYTINNCKNYGNVIGDFSGGICGKGDLYPSTNYTNNINNNIKYCISEGEVIGNSSGGIYGSKCGFNNTDSIIVNVNIYRCINKGKINSFGSGGICGINCGNITYDNQIINNSISNVSISKCINYGNVHRESGGICGKYCCNIIDDDDDSINIANSTINVNINECKNYSNVRNVSGGILGRFSNNCKNNNTCNIKISKCRTKGNVKKSSSAICGPDSYYNGNNGYTSLLINDCKSKSICDKNSSVFLGNNCSGKSLSKYSIIIKDNKFYKEYNPYLNLRQGTKIQYTNNKNIN